MGHVEQEHITEVFQDLAKHLNESIFPWDTTDYLRRVLVKALGPEKAAQLMGRIVQEEDDEDDDESSGIEALRDMDGKTLANFLREEYPQTIAFILAHLRPEHAGEIFSLLDEDVQKEVAYRITQLSRTPPEVIKEVSDVLRKEIREVRGKDVGGVKAVADMLNYVEKAAELRVIGGFDEIDPELAKQVRAFMFVFEDLVQIDDKSMQQLIREVERDKWVVALRTASSQLKKKVFSSMSERAGTLLREELESMGPVRLRDVEKTQREILDMAREMEAEGKIYLTTGKGKKEDLLV